MRKAFLAGWPVSHSKSPLLHSHWLQSLGVEGSYEAVPVEPGHLESFFNEETKKSFVGGNVTIPHKEEAFRLAEVKDAAATAIGAANTIWFDKGKTHASNTDAYGFSANLDDHTPQWRDGDTAMVFGAGGASRAIVHAIIQAGYSRVMIVNRTLERAIGLVDRFGETCSAHPFEDFQRLLGRADLLVNTTSIGMEGADQKFPFSLSNLPGRSIVTDLVYTPLETPLLKAARERGNKTVDGLGMLLHQAVPGFELWFGERPEVTRELREKIIGTGNQKEIVS